MRLLGQAQLRRKKPKTLSGIETEHLLISSTARRQAGARRKKPKTLSGIETGISRRDRPDAQPEKT